MTYIINTIAKAKKELIDVHPADSYANNCLRAEGMRNSFRNYTNCEHIKLTDKQRQSINWWIDEIMMK